MDSLIKTGKVVRGYLGVSIQDVNPKIAKQFGLDKAEGALVSDVVADAPADKAGIQSGDVIIRYEGKPVENTTALRHRVAETPVGKTVDVEVLRDKKPRTIKVRITEQPKDMTASTGESVGGGDDKAATLAGLSVRDLSRETTQGLNLPRGIRGVVVTEVEAGSPSDEAGILAGDVILEINRKPLRNTDDFRKLAGALGKDDTVLLRIVRNGQRLYVAVNP